MSSQEHLQRQHPYPEDFDQIMTWKMRWFLSIAIIIIYTLSLIGGLIAYWKTNDLHFLLFITPTILIPFVRYLMPMDKRRYEIELAKINANKDLSEARARIQLLEAELCKQQERLPIK